MIHVIIFGNLLLEKNSFSSRSLSTRSRPWAWPELVEDSIEWAIAPFLRLSLSRHSPEPASPELVEEVEGATPDQPDKKSAAACRVVALCEDWSAYVRGYLFFSKTTTLSLKLFILFLQLNRIEQQLLNFLQRKYSCQWSRLRSQASDFAPSTTSTSSGQAGSGLRRDKTARQAGASVQGSVVSISLAGPWILIPVPCILFVVTLIEIWYWLDEEIK